MCSFIFPPSNEPFPAIFFIVRTQDLRARKDFFHGHGHVSAAPSSSSATPPSPATRGGCSSTGSSLCREEVYLYVEKEERDGGLWLGGLMLCSHLEVAPFLTT